MLIAMRLPSGDTRGVPTYAPGLARSGSCLPVGSSHCTVALEPQRAAGTPACRCVTRCTARHAQPGRTRRRQEPRRQSRRFHPLEVEWHGEHRRVPRVHEMATRQVTRRPDSSRECLARAIGDGDDVNGGVVLARRSADDSEEHRFPTRQNLRMCMEGLRPLRTLQQGCSGASRWGQPQHTIWAGTCPR